MADVKVAENAAGDIALGVEVEGVFIPIAGVQAHRVGHLVERGHDLAEKVEAGDLSAKETVEADFVVGGKSKSKAETKEGGN
jgi:hypothetical protein